ncbi:MAG: hypothetical protein KDB33_06925 [Acidimicrobiales bacterium]|nr:hypothetical protein [Acidimicrobiales bacterium]
MHTTTQPTALDVPPGLKGVVVADTAVGDVRGEEGFFHYGPYDATELARTRTVDDVWFLLVHGRLPSAAELATFRDEVAALRRPHPAVQAAIPTIAAVGGGALDGLRTALSLQAAATGLRPVLDLTPDERRRDAVALAAVTPTLVAGLWRAANGLEPIAPRDDLHGAAGYLWQLHGVEPDPVAVRALEQYLVLTIDHGFNASTFTGRVVASTGASVGDAVCAAIGALAGPLHGGAPSRALDALDAIGEPERAADWVRGEVAAGRRIMGFGHAVYRTDDPRSVLLREIATRMGAPKAAFARDVESAVVDTLAELKPDRKLYANVEFYAGVVMEAAGLPPELFTPTFAVSRVIGWTANILEQADDNRIIRPSARYTGPPPTVPTAG